MRNYRIVVFALFLLFTTVAINGFSQANEKPKGGKERPLAAQKERQQQMAGIGGGGHCLLKATEQSVGKYTIHLDFGKDKDGNDKIVFKEEKDKETLDKAIKENSLIDVLNFLAMKGFEVVSCYAVSDSKVLNHYYLLQRGSMMPAKGGKKGAQEKPVNEDQK